MLKSYAYDVHRGEGRVTPSLASLLIADVIWVAVDSYPNVCSSKGYAPVAQLYVERYEYIWLWSGECTT